MNKLIVAIALNAILSGLVFAEIISCPSEISFSEKKDLKRKIKSPFWTIEEKVEAASNCPSGLYTYIERKKEKNKNKIALYNPITISADEYKKTGMELHCEYETKFIDWKGGKTCVRTFLTTEISQVTGSGWDYIYYVTPRNERKMTSICRKEESKHSEKRSVDYKNCTAIK